jgi:hypothetical protein
MIALLIVRIDERAREVDDHKQYECMAKHRCIEIGDAIERRTYRLSDQENNH